ncbi:hypothetical protein [Pseudalkalibacillus hwajinpoensis]|uniref:hypothetical protein n=1 Tax=Guptibacillus hwajinpoensis TaxID=208199 RepID=UPI001CD5FFF0|nr:hypothetical protein [Pseudalkalibacillus hwajinpoensis]MCA0990837.1 hypothetical protein [Pseudalkalibacillus hwajinpoensis]
MKVVDVTYEHLKKERSNSPEDSFVRSTVTYVQDGTKKRFHVLYPAIFGETAKAKGIWGYDLPLQEAVALSFLSFYPGRKRLYMNTEEEFFRLLDKSDLSQLYASLIEIKKNKSKNTLNSEKMSLD